jgi:hypothetical protein
MFDVGCFSRIRHRTTKGLNSGTTGLRDAFRQRGGGKNGKHLFVVRIPMRIIANFVFSTAKLMVADGANWGSKVCSAARSFCNDPQQLLYAGVALGCLWLLMKFISAVRY